MKRLLPLIAVVLIALLGLAGCGSGSGNTPAAPAASGGSTTPAATPPASGSDAPAASGEAYPTKPITFYVTHSVGGGIDIAARTIQMPLQEEIGQPIVVDNRPGAGGLTALNLVHGMSNDGYSILCASVPSMLLKKYMTAEESADIRTMTPIAAWVNGDSDPIMVAPDSPYQTLEAFIEAAKGQQLTIGLGGGAGSSDHLVYVLLKEKLGLDLVAVPFDSAAECVAAIMGGHVNAGIGSISSSSEPILTGNVNAIAITGAERCDIIPDVPTFVEKGYPDIVVEFHIGAFAPAGMDPAKVQILCDAIEQAFGTEAFNELTVSVGVPAGEFYNTERWAQYVNDQDVAMQEAASLIENNPI